MHALLRNWRIWLVIGLVLASIVIIAVKGIRLGADFTGGTVLLFKFDKPLTTTEMKDAVQILERRLNWTGLSDVTVRPWGDQYVMVRVGDVDPDQVSFIKQSILRQGKFEATVEGEVALEGKDVILQGGYSIYPDHANGGWRWEIPFLLTEDGARRFFGTLKKYCTVTSCPDNFFFIDRPVGAIVIMDENLYQRERVVSKDGQYPPGQSTVDLNGVIKNAGVTLVVYDGNLPGDVNFAGKKVIIPDTLKSLKPELEEKGASEVIIVPVRKTKSWIWEATNLRAIIGVSPSLRSEIVAAPEDNPVITTSISITGWAPTKEEALQRVEELKIILSSGALPAGLSLVSEKTIPPTYGFQSFLVFMVALVIAMIAVALFIALRYREKRVSIPIISTIFSEIIAIFGFASLIGWRLDVASLVGIIASVGSGVDDQIIITDEMLHGKRREEEKDVSLLQKIKRAFFLVFASASALGAAVLPLWFSGIPTLMGFAVTTLTGIVVGVFITRPAYAEILKYLLTGKRKA